MEHWREVEEMARIGIKIIFWGLFGLSVGLGSAIVFTGCIMVLLGRS